MIKGITVQLKVKTETCKNEFNAPVYEEEWVDVKNVLVGEPITEFVITDNVKRGKRIQYTLGIPKKDEHIWEDTEVRFFNREFSTIGFPEEGIEQNVPGLWHRKVKVECYEC